MASSSVSVVMTVLNDPEGCAVVLDSLATQLRAPDEIIVVDGGSRDGTLDGVRAAGANDSRIRLIEAAGANISRGRNIGIRAARGGIIALTDSGCRLDARWLAEMVKPFVEDATTEFVAGVYRIAPHSLLERVVGLATMPGQLDPVCPESFNPSARSMAFTKDAWRRAGGFPEWLYTAEDTLFDVKMRKLGVNRRFADEAAVYWRPRGTVGTIARQFYLYGRGGGHTQLSARANLYNIRNLALTVASVVAAWCIPWLWIPAALMIAYFYCYAFHEKSARIMRTLSDGRAYFVSLVVHWTVLLSDTAGYIVGTIQRFARPKRYRDAMIRYLNMEVREPDPQCKTRNLDVACT